ncbi:MAG: DUF2169 domain-containing protein [Polyangiaceae bacterium]|nr:DUF2169 domain-containing protein [Polyangiaceae bacterium]
MGIAIEVLPIGPVAVDTRVWRHRGRRLFTAIVKASFAIQHDGPMTVLPPLPIFTEEQHYRGNPVASLVRGSDFALAVPKPEIVIVGSAYAAPGQKTTQTTVRLAVQRQSTIVVNKRLEIFGDRRARPGAPAPEPALFQSMPILYERAHGGIASRENPVGVGMATEPDGLLTLPNIQLPQHGGYGPAGLGPIPSAWPLRQKKRGSLGWTAANLSRDVDVPDDFDDAYYQTAPLDQQTAELKGGDLIAIVNMHPQLAMLRAHIPMLRAVAMAQTSRGDRLPLNLRIDTVHLEPEALRAEIVFRGAALVAERDLGDLRLAATLEQPEVPCAFPDLATLSGLVARRTDASVPPPNYETTAVIGEPAAPNVRALGVRALHDSSAPPAMGAREMYERVGRSGTMVMESSPPANTPLQEVTEERRATTMVIEAESPPRSLPFDKNARGNAPAAPQSTEGTPWATDPMDNTFDVVEETTTSVAFDPRLEEPTQDVDSNTDTPRRPGPSAVMPAVSSSREGRVGQDTSSEARQAGAAPTRLGSPEANAGKKSLKQDLYKKLKR